MKTPKYWNPESFEVSSFKFHLANRVNASFNTSGSDTSGKCIYTYNSLGFRGDEPTQEGLRVMSIGDSNTEGVGLNDDETWSHQLCKLIPNAVDLNFGFGGRSNDYMSRCLLTYYDLIKPDLVLIMYTSPQRREIYTKDGGVEPYMPTSSWGYLKETLPGVRIQSISLELQNHNEDLINWYKNHLLIKYFLESKKCNWLWSGSFNIPISYQESNRFDGKDNKKWLDIAADGGHPGPLHNKKYATDLHNFINTNFPDYFSLKRS